MIQKFKSGDKVRVLFGHPMWGGPQGVVDIAPYLVGKLATIEGSYWDLYSHHYPKNKQPAESHLKDYAIIYEDGSTSAWYYEGSLELVEEGTSIVAFKIKVVSLIKTRIIYPYQRWRRKQLLRK